MSSIVSVSAQIDDRGVVGPTAGTNTEGWENDEPTEKAPITLEEWTSERGEGQDPMISPTKQQVVQNPDVKQDEKPKEEPEPNIFEEIQKAMDFFKNKGGLAGQTANIPKGTKPERVSKAYSQSTFKPMPQMPKECKEIKSETFCANTPNECGYKECKDRHTELNGNDVNKCTECVEKCETWKKGTQGKCACSGSFPTQAQPCAKPTCFCPPPPLAPMGMPSNYDYTKGHAENSEGKQFPGCDTGTIGTDTQEEATKKCKDSCYDKYKEDNTEKTEKEVETKTNTFRTTTSCSDGEATEQRDCLYTSNACVEVNALNDEEMGQYIEDKPHPNTQSNANKWDWNKADKDGLARSATNDKPGFLDKSNTQTITDKTKTDYSQKGTTPKSPGSIGGGIKEMGAVAGALGQIKGFFDQLFPTEQEEDQSTPLAETPTVPESVTKEFSVADAKENQQCEGKDAIKCIFPDQADPDADVIDKLNEWNYGSIASSGETPQEVAEKQIGIANSITAAAVTGHGTSYFINDYTMSTGTTQQNFQKMFQYQKLIANTDGTMTVSDSVQATTHQNCIDGVQFKSSEIIIPCGKTEVAHTGFWGIPGKLFGPGTATILNDNNIEIDNSVYDFASGTVITTVPREQTNLITGQFFGFFGLGTAKIKYGGAQPLGQHAASVNKAGNVVNIDAKGNIDVAFKGNVGLERLKVRDRVYGDSNNHNNVANEIPIEYRIKDRDYNYVIKSSDGSTQTRDKKGYIIQDNAPRFLMLDRIERQLLYDLR